MKKKNKNISFWKALRQNTKIRFITQLLLSLFVLYHLSMVLISPHVLSLAHKKLLPYFISYASTLSLNTSWNFYTPDSTYYYYWTYEVMEDKSKVGDFQWPPKRRESKRMYLNHNRLISHARFFIKAGPRRARRYFIPYLCRLHPSAHAITLKLMLKKRKARAFKPDLLSAENQKEMEKWSTLLHSKCKRKKQIRHIDSHISSLEKEAESSSTMSE